ncbi:hypothetical protein D1871_02195 [Nakamurella silvestris]|nr:hypothetical protein D1871_02195 [Nakamurella silvestris]
MNARGRAVDGGALLGAMTAGLAGAGAFFWMATPFTGSARAVLNSVGIFTVLVTVMMSVSLFRRASEFPGEAPARLRLTRPYVLTLAAEFAVLAVGITLLHVLDGRSYLPVWVSFLLGVHLAMYAWVQWAGFVWVGWALVAGAAVGLISGLFGAGSREILVVTGVIAILALLPAALLSLNRQLSSYQRSRVASGVPKPPWYLHSNDLRSQVIGGLLAPLALGGSAISFLAGTPAAEISLWQWIWGTLSVLWLSIGTVGVVILVRRRLAARAADQVGHTSR